MTDPDRRALPGRGHRLFLDSADTQHWRRWLPGGAFHGVTCNPLLLERAAQPCTTANLLRLAGEARDLGAREIHLQAWGDTPEDLCATGRQLATAATDDFDVAVKVPATEAGFRAVRILRNEGCRITVTAVFQPGQVLLAAAAGAAYAAPYLGRLDDAGRDGSGLVHTMHRLLAGAGATMRLLVASLRSADQVVALAAAGLDTFTFGPTVAEQLLADPLTTRATADFQRAAEEGDAP